MKVQVVLPMEGCRPNTVISFDAGAPVWDADEKVGTIIGVAEVRHDEVLIDIEVDNEDVANTLSGERAAGACHWSIG